MPLVHSLVATTQLVTQEGICKPPLRRSEGANLLDPFVLSYRRGLVVVAEGQQLCIRHAADGSEVARFGLRQRIWVELSAEGSRAHGPALRMRLLADDHPAALEAAAGSTEPADAGSPTAAWQAALQGCVDPLLNGPSRAYRPPGVRVDTAATAQHQHQPGAGQQRLAGAGAVRWSPPGFLQPLQQLQQKQHQQLPQSQVQRQQAGAGTGAGPLSTSEALAAALQLVDAAEQQQQQAQDCHEVELSALSLAALARLRQRASRAALLAVIESPGNSRAKERAHRAEQCRQQLEELRAQLEAVPS